MQLVITDYTFPDLSIEEQIFSGTGFTLVSGQAKTPEALIPLVKNADAVITQFAPVNASVIEAMERAKVIGRYGIMWISKPPVPKEFPFAMSLIIA